MPADLIVNVGLAVTEAAANAVRHSGCDDFEVRGWTTGASLIVCVWDQGRGRAHPDPGGGLGIRIVRALAESVDFEDTHPGTRVTMRFSGARGSGAEAG
jgi:two-component sensor histidine kinase